MARPRPARRWILLAASYFFYMCWNAKFVLLIVVLTAIDYTAAMWMRRLPAGGKRKAALVMSLAANLGFLGFFKYYNFLAGNLALRCWPGRSTPSRCDIILPMGISFHTFQSMSYVIDVYRGEQEPSPIRSTTRSTSRSSRNWWPARSCARAISSPIFTIGARPMREEICAAPCWWCSAW